MKKINNTITVVMGGVAVVAICALVAALAIFADWSEGGIIALATGFSAVFVGAVLQLRQGARIEAVATDVAEQTASQTTIIRKIDSQTNGGLDDRISVQATMAARAAVREALDNYNGPGTLPRRSPTDERYQP